MPYYIPEIALASILFLVLVVPDDVVEALMRRFKR